MSLDYLLRTFSFVRFFYAQTKKGKMKKVTSEGSFCIMYDIIIFLDGRLRKGSV